MKRDRRNRDDSSQGPPGGEARAAFRQEDDRLVLTSQVFALGFSAHHGAVVSLHHRQTQADLVDSAEAEAHSVLWRLEVAAESRSPVVLTSRGCDQFGHEVSADSEGRLRLRLHWAGLRAGATRVEGSVTVVVTFPAAPGPAWLDLEADLPGHIVVQSVDFPCVGAVGSADALADESLFLPLSGGVLVEDPRSVLAAPGGESGWQAAYPGPASLQMFGFLAGRRTALWLAGGDPSGARKTLTVATMARSNRLALSIAHQPSRAESGTWPLGYPCALGLTMGDWFEAAREYRVWATRQPWCARGRGGERDLPALTRAYGLWLSHWGDSRRAVIASRELQRLANVPIKLDWRCWHHSACGGAYPDYFPPRDGEEAFAAARRHLADAGVLTQLTFDGLLASPQSQAWEWEGAQRYAVMASPGAGPASDLVPMCPSTRYWRQKLVSLAREAARLGVEGVRFQSLGDSEPHSCEDPDHGHGLASPGAWAAGVRMALGEVKAALGADLHLAADGPAEVYLDLVDAFFSTHPAAEREGLLPAAFGGRWSPIPLFASVYHGYATLVGPGASLANARPQDPLSPQAGADPRLPLPLMERDFQGQFCLEVGRAAVWGHQLMLTNFSPEQARDDADRRKLAFLSAVLRAQAWGVGALLPFAEFLGMLDIESPRLELELLVNPPGSAPSDRRSVRRGLAPVLGSAWGTPGGGVALVLANLHDQPADFATRLRSARMTVNLPLQLMGRTFSEDGDVPAATLRTSGAEISGRVPARSVVLLSLR